MIVMIYDYDLIWCDMIWYDSDVIWHGIQFNFGMILYDMICTYEIIWMIMTLTTTMIHDSYWFLKWVDMFWSDMNMNRLFMVWNDIDIL